jgi:hypothetical protein
MCLYWTQHQLRPPALLCSMTKMLYLTATHAEAAVIFSCAGTPRNQQSSAAQQALQWHCRKAVKQLMWAMQQSKEAVIPAKAMAQCCRTVHLTHNIGRLSQ